MNNAINWHPIINRLTQKLGVHTVSKATGLLPVQITKILHHNGEGPNLLPWIKTLDLHQDHFPDHHNQESME